MSRWHSLWARLRDLLRGSRLNREIDDELRFHVEEEIEAGVRRGLTPEQARKEAHDSLGGTLLLVREQIRDARDGSSWTTSIVMPARAYGCCDGIQGLQPW